MTSDQPVPPMVVRQHISGCEKRWEQQEARTRALEETMIETTMRLENGTHAFRDLREHQNTMEVGFAEKVAELQPKPPSVSKVVGIVLAVVSMSAGALWGLSSMLNDRPTTEQIEKIMEGHGEHGHRQTGEELRSLRDIQITQGAKIENIGTAVQSQDAKLDTLLKQTQLQPNRRAK